MRDVFHTRSARGLAFLVLLLFAAVAVGAQTLPGMEEPPPIEPVSDDELQDFAAAYVEVQVIQEQLDQQMDARLQSSDLGADRFYEINQIAQESDPSDGLPGVDDGELTEYRDLLQDLLALREQLQNQMVEAVSDEGLTVERFNEIIVAIQQDQSVAEQAQEYIQQAMESHRQG